MKLLFSEARSDFNNYIFPYAIWAIPERDDRPGELFNKGFLPASRDLDRFYLCRNIRINLSQFKPSSENRRVLRKGKGITFQLIPRSKFRYSARRRKFYKNYADIKFGKNVMTYDRLDALFQSKTVSHLLLFTDSDSGEEVGTVTLYLESNQMAYYYFCFYDLNYYQRNLGIYIMTTAVRYFANEGIPYIYLGTVYSRNALYKTQFSGMEFFNGFEWNSDLAQLKYLLKHDAQAHDHHLLESNDFLKRFYKEEVKQTYQSTDFELK